MGSKNIRKQPTADLVGTWRLISYEARAADGRVQHPLGENVSGLLVYDESGNVSAHVMRNDLAPFASTDPARATDAELRSAFDGYGSYFGTYDIDKAKQTVTHHVCGAWFPNWIRHDQVRYFKLDGNRLSLTTSPMTWHGQKLKHVLTWERVM